ncbi:hypothetical protein CXB51_014809 [Gossypium anomalum]|uniref:CCHC-type domain-containing protein n=1 Tax=Gossypium anomalum TaxID=47600 RepID=A0A8J5YY01_9ROSI|nr:hypothetical protein CXB51_014809 [Gossypium anomalum]
MEEELANLRLLDKEEEAFQEEAAVVDQSYQFCLVGRCLTDSVVHFSYLRNTVADLWHPVGGICISDLGEKRYLFQFFHDVDVQKVLSSTPWFFNNHLIILQKVQRGEDPSAILLNFTEFWVQIHDLPSGLITKTMAMQFGEFLGKLLEYDTFIPTLGLKKFMRIRVRLDISNPLKRTKRIQIGKATTVYARFQYENLSLFCFICGKLGHDESYCPFCLRIEPSKIIFGWDISLHTVARRHNAVVSRWLREADGSQWSNGNMESINQSSNWENDSGRNLKGDSWKQSSNPNLIPLKSGQQILTKGPDSWRNLGSGDLNGSGSKNGPRI